MPSVLAKTTVSACLAALPVFLPQALAPASRTEALPKPTDVVGRFGTHYRLVPTQRFLEVANTSNLPKPMSGTQVATVTTAPPPDVIPGGGGGLAAPPPVVMSAYENAAARANMLYPGCAITWPLLAGIGQMESHQAASGGSATPGWNGIANPPIIGPALNGANGTKAIPDTDHGKYDGDKKWDHAVGPMQFLPSTWATYGVAASGDGTANPQDIRDSAAAAADYLCKGGVNLGDPVQLASAIYSYNAADWYVADVMTLMSQYADLAVTAPGADAAVRTAISWAYAHLGDPYQWGGNGPYYDCSGFTRAAYASAGIAIPRTSEQQWLALPHVADGQLRVGDLVFFNPGEFIKGLPGHVGIYIGSGYMIADPHTGSVVQVQPVTGAGQYVGAARPALLPVGNPVPDASLPGSGNGTPSPSGSTPPVSTPGTPAGNKGGGKNGNNGPGSTPTPTTPFPVTPPPTTPTPTPTTDPLSSGLNRHRPPATGSSSPSITSASPQATP